MADVHTLWGEGLAVSGHPLSEVSVRERRISKGHFIIIFLYKRLKKNAKKK